VTFAYGIANGCVVLPVDEAHDIVLVQDKQICAAGWPRVNEWRAARTSDRRDERRRTKDRTKDRTKEGEPLNTYNSSRSLRPRMGAGQRAGELSSLECWSVTGIRSGVWGGMGGLQEKDRRDRNKSERLGAIRQPAARWTVHNIGTWCGWHAQQEGGRSVPVITGCGSSDSDVLCRTLPYSAVLCCTLLCSTAGILVPDGGGASITWDQDQRHMDDADEWLWWQHKPYVRCATKLREIASPHARKLERQIDTKSAHPVPPGVITSAPPRAVGLDSGLSTLAAWRRVTPHKLEAWIGVVSCCVVSGRRFLTSMSLGNYSMYIHKYVSSSTSVYVRSQSHCTVSAVGQSLGATATTLVSWVCRATKLLLWSSRPHPNSCASPSTPLEQLTSTLRPSCQCPLFLAHRASPCVDSRSVVESKYRRSPAVCGNVSGVSDVILSPRMRLRLDLIPGSRPDLWLHRVHSLRAPICRYLLHALEPCTYIPRGVEVLCYRRPTSCALCAGPNNALYCRLPRRQPGEAAQCVSRHDPAVICWGGGDPMGGTYLRGRYLHMYSSANDHLIISKFCVRKRLCMWSSR